MAFNRRSSSGIPGGLAPGCRSVLVCLFLALVTAGAGGCKSRPTGSGGPHVARPDAASDAPVANAEDSGRGSPEAGVEIGDPDPPCPAMAPGAARPGGEACRCDNECADGYCHEGACCTGAACSMRPPGVPCTAADQCASGFCADGVCCNQSCSGGCVSCNQPEQPGECGPVPVGTPDPHGVCRQDSPQSCGQSGMCNGQGGCAKYASGTSCGLGVCQGGRTSMGASECDGDGLCVAGQPLDCHPFLCEDGACKQSCVSDADCVAPNVCREGSCGPRGNGQACADGSQCGSGNCVDGVCCDTPCTGRCQFCASAGSRGTCTPVRAGTRDPRAAMGLTDPARVCLDQGPGACGTDGTCDGSGGCRKYQDGTVCRARRCDSADNSETAASVCMGGSCRAPAARTCAPYRGCNGSRCVTECDSDGQCSAGNVCTGGDCGKRPVGAICSRNADCAAPGICAQGRCCATACAGTCMACNVEGSLGTCRPVPVGGADPTGACRDDACSNGCNGQGGCRREAPGTSCRAATCAAGTLTTHTCTAAGACQMTSAPCPEGQVCMGNRCAPPAKKEPGEQCLANGDCLSNACLGGRCCATRCAGPPCLACTAATMWACRPAGEGLTCGMDQVCRNGACVANCPPGQTMCPPFRRCLNLQNNRLNCGKCGNACPLLQVCRQGACIPRRIDDPDPAEP